MIGRPSNDMKLARTARCIAVALLAVQLVTAASSHFTDAEANGIKTYLREHFRETNACIVIGLIDERGSKVFGAGKLDNGTDKEPDGDTVFFIGSVSKTFTALILQDMVERGEMKPEDPVAKYL